jgi:hypothetical protein
MGDLMSSSWKIILRLLAAQTLVLSLAACGPQQAPIDISAISAVQGEIKRQILVYMLVAEKAPIMAKVHGQDIDLRNLDPDSRREYFWCGNGNIDYDITSVKAELQTSLVQKVGASFGFTVPVPLAPSGTISFSRQATNSQTLDYTLWPLDLSLQRDELRNQPMPTVDELYNAQIAQVLLNLRYAQIATALKIDPVTGVPRDKPQACLTNFNLAKPAGDSKNSYTMGLTVTVSVDGSVSVGVSALKLGLSAGGSTTSGHSLTVAFVQRGLDDIQSARDIVDKKCAYPNAYSKDCMAARQAYTELIEYSMTGTPMSPQARRILGPAGEHASGDGSGGAGTAGGFGVLRKKFDKPLRFDNLPR